MFDTIVQHTRHRCDVRAIGLRRRRLALAAFFLLRVSSLDSRTLDVSLLPVLLANEAPFDL